MSSSAILEARGLTRRFAGLVAVHDVSFALAPGEILGFIGPNGAGKTTLISLLSGTLDPSEGEVWFDGKRIDRMAAFRRARLGIGRTFQIMQPFPGLSVLDNVAVGALFGRGERVFKLDEKPMVHLTYQTAFVDDAGKLQLREDIYGFDERIRTILHSDERRIADLAPPQDAKREMASAQANQDILRRVERGEAPNVVEFFDHLPSAPPRGEVRHAAAHPRSQPVAAAGPHPDTAQSPFPFLAIFGR